MTEKRFNMEYVYGNPTIWHITDYREHIVDEKICDLLNEQHEQIERLKRNFKTLDEVKCELAEENEQLKKELHKIKVVNEMLSMDFANSEHELWKENEQLKQTMQEVAELLSEEVDLFSDKATEHDICAYVELKELDNKDAYYMAISTKKAIKMLKGDVE